MTEREIALMQEYRTRLTADVVTGKLDVRSAAVQLPELEEDAVLEGDSGELVDDLEAEGVEE
jgi:type I restriction enzyme S subunit